MMYGFIDTTDFREQTKILPSEAVMINGVYLENVIEGYRTLYVKGREALSPAIEVGEVGVRSGAYLKNKRFPARVLTVGYQIVADSLNAFNTAFMQLNDLLNVEEAQIMFADETDKYLTGTPSGFDEIPAGQLSVKGEYTIVCTDPFKYSITEYEVAPTLDDGATFFVDYQGTYPAYPVLQTDFYKNATKGNTDGNCGFVAFSTQNADVLQFGYVADPDAVNAEVQELVDTQDATWLEKKCLVNEPFDSLTGWASNNGYTGSIYYLANGTPAVDFLNSGTDKAVYASGYGSGSQWHGCTVKRAIPNDGGNPSTTGAVDWELHGTMRFAPSKTAKTAKKQAGRMTIAVLDANGRALAGILVSKKKGTSQGEIRMIVNNKAVKTYKNVDLSYYNRYFGYVKPTNSGAGARQQTANKRPCNYDITKDGSKFTFNAGGKTFSFTLEDLADVVATHVSIFISAWGDLPAVSWMGVYSCQFTSNSVKQTKTTETWEQLTEKIEVQNTFTTNDILVCDCADGSVRLLNAYATDEISGGLHPELGALGNDWESFVLTKGSNQIGTMYSDWVEDAYKPTFTLRYRERYL